MEVYDLQSQKIRSFRGKTYKNVLTRQNELFKWSGAEELTVYVKEVKVSAPFILRKVPREAIFAETVPTFIAHFLKFNIYT